MNYNTPSTTPSTTASGGTTPTWVNTLIGNAGSIFGGIATIVGAATGNAVSQVPQYNGASDPVSQKDNTVIYIVIAVIVIAALYFLIKK